MIHFCSQDAAIIIDLIVNNRVIFMYIKSILESKLNFLKLNYKKDINYV